MKRITTLIVFLLFSLLSIAYASVKSEAEKFAREYVAELSTEKQVKPSVHKEEVGLQLPRHSGEIGTEAYYFRYQEPDVMKENGSFYGLTTKYTFRDKLMFRVEGRTAAGQVDYKNSGSMDDINDYTIELRGLGGYDFPIFTKTLVTPYLGVAYRYLNDDARGTTSTGALGYQRESNYFYSPIGIETMTGLKNAWSLVFTLEYDYFWRGVQKSHLSDADRGFNDLENDQNHGYGARGSVRLFKKAKNIDFIIEPFVRYWNIKKSEEENVTFAGVIIGYGYEPKNNTIETGINFALNF